jgi:hypothetical protein
MNDTLMDIPKNPKTSDEYEYVWNMLQMAVDSDELLITSGTLGRLAHLLAYDDTAYACLKSMVRYWQFGKD